MSTLSSRLYGRIERFWARYRVPIGVTVLVLAFLLIYFWNNIFVSVHSGQQGVLWNRFYGTLVDDAYNEGLHFIAPWNEMTIYDLRLQEDNDTLVALSTDGMEINLIVSILHRPLQAEIGYIHRAVGPNYYQNLIRPTAVAALRLVVGTMRAEDLIAIPEVTLLARVDSNIYSGNYTFQYQLPDEKGRIRQDTSVTLPQDFASSQQQVMPEDLINLFQVNVKLRSLQLPPKIQAAINEKLVHEQAQESYRFRLLREEQEAERKKIEALGISEFQRISGISMLKWRGIEATQNLAESQNSKIIIIGTGENELPVILNADTK